MTLELTFLGTGTSAGVPMIGCECEVCQSDDPRDNRSRPSVVVSYPDESVSLGRPRRLLIDTTPELRLQITRQGINAIDGVMYTHAHADHIFGIDDLRRFNVVMDAPVEILAEQRVLNIFHEMFPYIFQSHRNINKSFIPTLIERPVEPGRTLDLYGASVTPLRLNHGRLPILGFRVDWQGRSLAYCTDVSSFPPETYLLLGYLDVLVIDGLRYRHHPTHLTIDQALREIEQIAPKRAYLTHMAHDVSHAALEATLPDGVAAAYDGLIVDIP